MITKQFETIIRLRRDNDYNYEKVKNTFIPADGEVVFVDVAGVGLRTKVGNGTDTYADLPFVGEDSREQVLAGYFDGTDFYYDYFKTELMPYKENSIYIDKTHNKIYTYNGSIFIAADSGIATASAETAGILKLYQSTGQNIDGTMSQKAISDELSYRYKTRVDSIDEQLTFYN